MSVRLDEFTNDDFDRGRSRPIEACWRTIEGVLFDSWLPGSIWRTFLLRFFGAIVGRGVIIKPHVRVKFPWKLRIGDHSWIGESVWIDNLAQVSIGSHCCVSQGVYLCTGNHRWDTSTFDLEIKSIVINDQCWIGAMARIGPGVVVAEGAVIGLGEIVTQDVPSWTIYTASQTRDRHI